MQGVDLQRSVLEIFGPPIVSSILSAIGAALLSGYVITRWKTREDAIERRLDELIGQIEAVAKCASDYWQLPPTDTKVKIEGYRVMAGIARLDGLRSALRNFISASSTSEISNAASSFLRACTGGDFGVHNRPSDIGRASQVLLEGAALAVTLRTARMRDLEGSRRRQ